MSIDLRGLRAAVLGGDGRETETLRLLKRHGADVSAYGCPPSVEKVLGKPQAQSVSEAVGRANIIICPIPYPTEDGNLYAPEAPEPIYLDEGTLGSIADNAVLITGVSTPSMQQAAEKLGFSLREYEDDDELMILRSAAIVEGAVCVAVRHSPVSIHQSNVLIVGFGRIGTALAQLLLGMRARCYTCTPLPIERAHAYQMGFTVCPLEELSNVVGDMAIIFNTIPVKVFTREVLKKVPAESLLIDIVAPPGGVDREAAEELSVNFVWARGLGGVAPRTVAESQWIGIERILHEELTQG